MCIAWCKITNSTDYNKHLQLSHINGHIIISIPIKSKTISQSSHSLSQLTYLSNLCIVITLVALDNLAWFPSLPSLGHSGNMQQLQVNLCKHLFLPCSKNKSLMDYSECRLQTREKPLFYVGRGPISLDGTVPPTVELCVLASFGIGKYIINYSQYST